MQRRSALGRLAATLTGLSVGRMPTLAAAVSPAAEGFSVSPANLPESVGTVTCSICHGMSDALELTLAGPCLSCADQVPAIRATPRSGRFWLLSPAEIKQAEGEIEQLAAELDRMNQQLVELRRHALAGDSDYAEAIEEQREAWLALQRELHLLQLLRAASRQSHFHSWG